MLQNATCTSLGLTPARWLRRADPRPPPSVDGEQDGGAAQQQRPAADQLEEAIAVDPVAKEIAADQVGSSFSILPTFPVSASGLTNCGSIDCANSSMRNPAPCMIAVSKTGTTSIPMSVASANASVRTAATTGPRMAHTPEATTNGRTAQASAIASPAIARPVNPPIKAPVPMITGNDKVRIRGSTQPATAASAAA